MQQLVRCCPGVTFAGVISDTTHAAGLKFLEQQHIPCYPFDRIQYPDRASFRTAVRAQARELAPDLIVLAGYMQILEPEFIELFSDKVINIHPSLLPAYPGLHTHERVISAGDTTHGCTVHLVDSGIDTGPIIAQAIVDILPDDTPETLAARVLKKEHLLFPWVVNHIAAGNITVRSSSVLISQEAITSAAEYDFFLRGTSVQTV